MLILLCRFDYVHIRGRTWATRLVYLGDVVFASSTSKLDGLSDTLVPPFVDTERPTDP